MPARAARLGGVDAPTRRACGGGRASAPCATASVGRGRRSAAAARVQRRRGARDVARRSPRLSLLWPDPFGAGGTLRADPQRGARGRGGVDRRRGTGPEPRRRARRPARQPRSRWWRRPCSPPGWPSRSRSCGRTGAVCGPSWMPRGPPRPRRVCRAARPAPEFELDAVRGPAGSLTELTERGPAHGPGVRQHGLWPVSGDASVPRAVAGRVGKFGDACGDLRGCAGEVQRLSAEHELSPGAGAEGTRGVRAVRATGDALGGFDRRRRRDRGSACRGRAGDRSAGSDRHRRFAPFDLVLERG